MDGFKLVEGPINVEDYMRLREAAGWHELDYDKAEAALANSLFSVYTASMTEVVGCARVVGDGGAYFYVQDVLVLPEFGNIGIADAMMQRVMEYLRSEAGPGAFVGLASLDGHSGSYVRFGYPEGSTDSPGMFRIWQGPDQGPLSGKGGGIG